MARISSTPMPGRVVDEQLRLAQRLERVRDLPVFLLADLPAQQAVGVDLRLGREHAHEQLLFRHFEAEEAGDAAVGRDVLAIFSTRLVLPIEGRAATMTRSPGCRPRVFRSMSVEPGRHAGDVALVLEQLLDLREAVA